MPKMPTLLTTVLDACKDIAGKHPVKIDFDDLARKMVYDRRFQQADSQGIIDAFRETVAQPKRGVTGVRPDGVVDVQFAKPKANNFDFKSFRKRVEASIPKAANDDVAQGSAQAWRIPPGHEMEFVGAGLCAVMGFLGMATSVGQVMREDEQGKKHVDLSALTWTIVSGAMAALSVAQIMHVGRASQHSF